MIDTALLRQIVANLEQHIRPDWLHEITAAADHIEKQEDARKAAREALEWTLRQSEEWLGAYTGGPDEDAYRERLQQARAALAALKGEQP